MNTPEELAFKNTTLTDVIDSLKPHHKIEIQLDRRAMDERSISAEREGDEERREDALADRLAADA